MENKEEIFVVKFPLKTEIWQEHILNRRFEYCREIYNEMRKKVLRTLHYYQNFKEWKEIENTTDYKKKNKLVQSFIKDHNLPFSEYGLGIYYPKFNKRYKQNGINSSIVENVGKHLWSGLEKYLYGRGKKLSYKEKDTLNSYSIRIKSGRFNGMNCDLKHSRIIFSLNDKQGKDKKTMTIPFIINNKSEYEMESFSNEIRVITIQREFIRGKWKYYVLFTFKGNKPNKGRKLGSGKVGIDIGPSSIAISSNNKVYIDELGKGVDKYEKEIKLIQNKLDRSRRQNNPLQFNENGTIKKYPKGTRPKWVFSKNYIKNKNKLKELYRKRSAKLKLEHTVLSNEILTYGDRFIVENNPIASWMVRAKETTINKNGKYNKKKRFGKSILNHAPSMLIEILGNKVKGLGGDLVKMDIKHGASQFDFTDGSKTKHELNERQVTLSNGDIHLRDTMAAFNIQHFENNEFNVDEMKKDYKNFCEMEQMEINRHIGQKQLKSFGITKDVMVMT